MFAGVFCHVEKNDGGDTLPVNSLNSVLSGLLASLLLSLGFSRLAARFDRVDLTAASPESQSDDQRSAAFCTTFSQWQEG